MYRGHQFPHAHLTWQQILLSLPSKSKHKWIISQDSTATTPSQITVASCLEYWSSFWSSLPCFYLVLLPFILNTTAVKSGHVTPPLKTLQCFPISFKVGPKDFAAPYTALHVLHSCCLSNFIAKLLSLSHSCSSNTGFTSLLVVNMLDTFLPPSLCTVCSSIYLHGFPLTSFKTLLKWHCLLVFKPWLKLQIATHSLLQSFPYPQPLNVA